MPADAVSERLEAFLKRHGYTGRKRRKRAARAAGQRAEGRLDELEMPRQEIVLALVSALEPIVARTSELASRIRHALDQHPDSPTFRSLFIAPSLQAARRAERAALD